MCGCVGNDVLVPAPGLQYGWLRLRGPTLIDGLMLSCAPWWWWETSPSQVVMGMDTVIAWRAQSIYRERQPAGHKIIEAGRPAQASGEQKSSTSSPAGLIRPANDLGGKLYCPAACPPGA